MEVVWLLLKEDLAPEGHIVGDPEELPTRFTTLEEKAWCQNRVKACFLVTRERRKDSRQSSSSGLC